MNHREPCPLCGAQPDYYAPEDLWGCRKHFKHQHCLYGPIGDPDGTKWNAMCRAIRARTLAEVREKVPQLQRWTPSYTGPDSMFRSAHGLYLDIADVLALLDNKEDDK